MQNNVIIARVLSVSFRNCSLCGNPSYYVSFENVANGEYFRGHTDPNSASGYGCRNFENDTAEIEFHEGTHGVIIDYMRKTPEAVTAAPVAVEADSVPVVPEDVTAAPVTVAPNAVHLGRILSICSTNPVASFRYLSYNILPSPPYCPLKGLENIINFGRGNRKNGNGIFRNGLFRWCNAPELVGKSIFLLI